MIAMNEVYIKEFENVSEFFSFIPEKLITRDHNYGFRGHASASWLLAPTIARFVDGILTAFPKRAMYREETTKIVLNRLRDEFKRNSIINNDLPQDRIENMDIWQYGQHFGLPSPLLDWTHSPYVALFFSLNENSVDKPDEKRCVWVIDLDLIDQINFMVTSQVWPKLREAIKSEESLKEQFPILEVLQEIDQNNRRLAFQQGFFTKHEYYVSLEVWLNRIISEVAMKNADRPVLHKYIFSCSEKERISFLDKLDKMNINNRTLFPDISGSVKDAIDSTFRSFQSPPTKTFYFSR